MSHERTSQKPNRVRRFAMMLLVLVLGYVVGITSQRPLPAGAEVRKLTNRRAFESGGEQSARILNQIASTLQRIEQRVQRIEKYVTAQPKD